MGNVNYDPYRLGLAGCTGSVEACRTCGVKPANQHTLGESSKCDALRYGRERKAREAREKEAAA